MEKIQLIESSSPCESNRASPTGGRRPLPFKRDLMGLSLSLCGGTLGTAATTGLFYQPRMIGEGDCGEIGGMKIGRGN
jgi:hypothetical protein